jgi:hypothetical protein
MKGYAALIESSEFDWSEAKLSCYGRPSGEHGHDVGERRQNKTDCAGEFTNADEANFQIHWFTNFRYSEICARFANLRYAKILDPL